MERRRNLISAILFLFAVISSICCSVYAQEGLWKSYLAEYKNLPGCSITTIAVDSNNTIWFGTDKYSGNSIYYDGLASFNNNSWLQYNISSLFPLRPVIYNITVDPQNNKWICTNYGVVKYDNNNFSRLTPQNSPLLSEPIYCAAIDKESNIYFSATDKIIKYSNNHALIINMPGITSRTIKVDSIGNLWIAMGTKGIAKYDGHNIKIYQHDISPFNRLDISCFDFNSNGEVWTIGSNGIGKLSNETWTYYPLPEGVYSANYLICHKDHNIYYTSESGIIKFDGVRHNYFSPGINKYMTTCRQIITDKNGTLWIGTQSEGAIKVQNGNWYNFNASNGLPSNSVNSVAVDHNNIKWVATSAGVARFDGRDWFTFNKYNSPLLSDFITSIHIDQNNILWVASINRGLARYDGNSWYIFTKENSGLVSDKINCITSSSDTIWIGTDYGLSSFSRNGWHTFTSSNSELPSDRIRNIAVDKNGVKWIITDLNHPVVKFVNNRWTPIIPDIAASQIGRIVSVYVDDTNNKWFGMSNGVLLYNNVYWQVFNKAGTGVDLSEIVAIKKDNRGNMVFGLFWFGGLVLGNGSTWTNFNTAYPFNSALGLPIDQISIDKQNNKWIATGQGGVFVFNEQGILLGLVNAKQNYPTDFLLYQNYPNPFNGTTKIEYTIKNSGPVKIVLFNALGEEVAVIANKSVEAGTHVEYFDSNGLPSGIYFYRLTFSNFSVAKKMILLK